jgi:hypothetical protein
MDSGGLIFRWEGISSFWTGETFTADYNLPRMRLSDRYTNSSGCTWSCRTSMNKINKNLICIHKIWGLESSRTGGLADTRIYKEVAAAKLTIKQNPICLWWLWRYMREWRTTKGVLGRAPTLRCAPIGLNSIHSPSGQNIARQHPDKFCMPRCFDVLMDGIGWCSNVRPDPLEMLSSYLSIHIKNVQNGVHMWSRWWFWCRLLLESESAFPNRIRLGLFVSLYHKYRGDLVGV